MATWSFWKLISFFFLLFLMFHMTKIKSLSYFVCLAYILLPFLKVFIIDTYCHFDNWLQEIHLQRSYLLKWDAGGGVGGRKGTAPANEVG